ncbi:MAG: ribosomal-protein-alanine N-acetyltransferase RimI, partial [Planktothrix sp.]
AWKRKLERATLEVKASNQRAINLYQKFGFKEAGRRKGYYPDTGEDALILWRGDLHRPHFPQVLHQWYHEICLRMIEEEKC